MGRGITALNIGTIAAGIGINALGAVAALPMTLGTSQTSPEVTFSDIEIPERLDALGGDQAYAIHEFPGGTRTLQAMGAFPTRLRWSGIFLGSTAFARSYTVDTLRRLGETAYLTYGPWKWQGLIVKYEAVPRHQNYVVYTVEFEPSVDLTGVIPLTPATSIGSLVASSLGSLGTTVASTTGLPSSVTSAVSGAVTAISNALTAAGNVVSSIGQSTLVSIEAAIIAAQAALAPYLQTSSNTQAAYNAASMNDQLNVLKNMVVTQAPAVSTTVPSVNPNLVTLSAQYLGDPTQWEKIATANGLIDPVQTGIETITIPG